MKKAEVDTRTLVIGLLIAVAFLAIVFFFLWDKIPGLSNVLDIILPGYNDTRQVKYSKIINYNKGTKTIGQYDGLTWKNFPEENLYLGDMLINKNCASIEFRDFWFNDIYNTRNPQAENLPLCQEFSIPRNELSNYKLNERYLPEYCLDEFNTNDGSMLIKYYSSVIKNTEAASSEHLGIRDDGKIWENYIDVGYLRITSDNRIMRTTCSANLVYQQEPQLFYHTSCYRSIGKFYKYNVESKSSEAYYILTQTGETKYPFWAVSKETENDFEQITQYYAIGIPFIEKYTYNQYRWHMPLREIVFTKNPEEINQFINFDQIGGFDTESIINKGYQPEYYAAQISDNPKYPHKNEVFYRLFKKDKTKQTLSHYPTDVYFKITGDINENKVLIGKSIYETESNGYANYEYIDGTWEAPEQEIYYDFAIPWRNSVLAKPIPLTVYDPKSPPTFNQKEMKCEGGKYEIRYFCADDIGPSLYVDLSKPVTPDATCKYSMPPPK